MDGRDPVWSPDEHLERVYQRGRQLRRRRRALLTSGTVGTLVLLVAAFTLVSAAGPGQRVRTAANPGATTAALTNVARLRKFRRPMESESRGLDMVNASITSH